MCSGCQSPMLCTLFHLGHFNSGKDMIWSSFGKPAAKLTSSHNAAVSFPLIHPVSSLPLTQLWTWRSASPCSLLLFYLSISWLLTLNKTTLRGQALSVQSHGVTISTSWGYKPSSVQIYWLPSEHSKSTDWTNACFPHQEKDEKVSHECL